MRGTRFLAGIIAGLGGVTVSALVLLGLFALEASLLLLLFPSHRSGGSEVSIGWDPISLWHQATGGKVLVLGILLGIGLLLIFPPLIAVLAGKYVYRRILRISAQS